MMLELVAICVLCAGDWSQFRGSNSDGHAVGPATPVEWSDTKNVAWKTSIPGLGWSSAAIAEGKAFLTTAVPREQGLSLRVMALDAKTGEHLYKFAK